MSEPETRELYLLLNERLYVCGRMIEEIAQLLRGKDYAEFLENYNGFEWAHAVLHAAKRYESLLEPNP